MQACYSVQPRRGGFANVVLNSYEYVFALLTDRLVGQHLQYTPMLGFKSIFQLCRFY